mgnify:CR=1 FL=1|tara:strand:+ start:558 stop:713 length:156 start_codon:yes stop_codon:yes gene_type:complete
MTVKWEDKEVHMVVPGYEHLSDEDRKKIDLLMSKVSQGSKFDISKLLGVSK